MQTRKWRVYSPLVKMAQAYNWSAYHFYISKKTLLKVEACFQQKWPNIFLIFTKISQKAENSRNYVLLVF